MKNNRKSTEKKYREFSRTQTNEANNNSLSKKMKQELK